MKRPIVGLGEVLWDLLPEGPRAGGAPFNFAFHCSQLGHPAIIISRVGNDELGQRLLAEVRRLGLTDEFIQVDLEHPTGTVPIRVDEQGQPSYYFPPEVAWDFLEWDDRLESLMRSAAAVCYGTLAQRSPLSRRTILRCVEMAERTALTVCDLNLRLPFPTAEVIENSLRLARWVKLNNGELQELQRILGTAELPDLLAWGPKLVCITNGERGSEVFFQNQIITKYALPIKVVDTVGAGDAFTAGLLTQVLEGQTRDRATRFATVLAGLVASRAGGTPFVERAEVERQC